MTEPIPLTPRQITSRAYYAANRGAANEKKRAWYAANKEIAKERMRAYSLANKEYEKEKKRAYYEANPEYMRNKKARRRDAPGVISPGWISKLLELQRWRCIACNVDLRFGHHIDHILPIARGGENTDYNLQALCPTCNLQKSDIDPIEFMQSRGFLL